MIHTSAALDSMKIGFFKNASDPSTNFFKKMTQIELSILTLSDTIEVLDTRS